MSTEADSGTVESFLKNNPRLMGAAFMMLLLLSGAGNAAAGGVGCVIGP
jgi:hypothetical protein